MSRELRSRLLTLLLLLIAAGGLYVYARRDDLLRAPRPVTGLLYPDLRVEDVTWLYLGLFRGQELELQREPGGRWRITQPTSEQAREDYVATLLDNLARSQVQPLEVGGAAVAARDVGLEPPLHQISFGAGAQRETLLLGTVEPLGRHVYVRRSGDRDIVLANRNLLTLLQFNAGDFTDPALLRGLRTPVTAVRLERDGAVILDAVRAGDRWTLREPVAARADEERVVQLIRSLQFAQQKRVVAIEPLPADLHASGLPDAAERAAGNWRGATLVELRTDTGETARVWLAAGWQRGAEEVLALREDGRKILAVPAAALAMLTNEPAFFRARQVLPPLRDRAETLRLERDGAVLLDIRRAADGSWSYSAPERLAGEPVETERVEAHSVLGDYLERLDRLEAIGFSDPPSGTPVARLSVTWTRNAEKRLDTLELHAPGPDGVPAVSSERPQEGLLLPADVLELFAPETPELLRQLTPLHVEDARWARFRVELPDGAAPLEVVRAPDGSWTGDDPWGRRYGLGRDLLRGLRGFRWQRARADASYPWRLSFLDAAGAELASLRLRLPGPGEPQEAMGFPCALAALPGHDGVELVIARPWVEQVQSLTSDLQRKP